MKEQFNQDIEDYIDQHEGKQIPGAALGRISNYKNNSIVKIKEKDIREYALYKGEEILLIGTIEEIAYALNVKKETVEFYKYPVYIKRLEERNSINARILVPLDDDLEDEDE